MLIVADEQIPYVQDAFGSIGTVRILPGRTITAEAVRDATVLLVRSVTPVTSALLDGSRVRFVGTATAGVDHIDRTYLKARGIGFACAAGANANAVAEYVMASLLLLATRFGFSLEGKTMGIIGVGHIGSLVCDKARALKIVPVLNDPPRAQHRADERYRPLDDALACDIVTLHVPLIDRGPFTTIHLLNARTLAQLTPSTILLNTARGPVIDNECLLQRLRRNAIGPTVLDVWEHEPNLSWALAQQVSLGTPHIAGYSLDGKAEGTHMLYHAVCRHFALPPSWSPARSLPPPSIPFLEIQATGKSDEQVLSDLATRVYNPVEDDLRLRQLLRLPLLQRPHAFDALRAQYPIRREFHRTTVRVIDGMPSLIQKIQGLGFRVEEGHQAAVPPKTGGN